MFLGDGFGVGFRGVWGGGFPVENEGKGEGGGEGGGGQVKEPASRCVHAHLSKLPFIRGAPRTVKNCMNRYAYSQEVSEYGFTYGSKR